MKCTNCNLEIDGGATFCGNCGQSVAETFKANSQNQVDQPSLVPNTDQKTVLTPGGPVAVTSPADQTKSQNPSANDVQSKKIGPGVDIKSIYPDPDAPRPPLVAPAPETAPEIEGGGKAIAALVCGIVGIGASLLPIAGLILGILAIVFGSITLKSNKRGFAIAGIILGSITVFLSLLFWVINILAGLTETQNAGSSLIQSIIK